MEVAGVALGAIPLLIEAFKHSVVAYRIFLDGNELEKVSSHLSTKVGIEEQRLVRWGESSGFGDSIGLDTSLHHNTALHDVITRTLICIKDILSDVDALKQKYGLRIRANDISESHAGPGRGLAIQSDATPLVQGPSDLRSLATKKAVSVRARFFWAIRDKDDFERLVEHLKYYNDSLYSLHRPDTSITISRDLVAVLLSSASGDRLRQLQCLSTSHASGPSTTDHTLYHVMSSAASVAMEIRQNTSPPHPASLVPRSQIELSMGGKGMLSRLATWTRTSNRQTRVLLEDKDVLLLAEREELHNLSLDHLQRLVSLLNHSVNIAELRTMRCLGLTSLRSNSVSLMYELPPEVDPMEEPITLYELMREDGEKGKVPALDDRIGLARIIATAIHRMHSAGWMHKAVSSKAILFFKNGASSGQRCLDLESPYLEGFRFSRPVTAHLSPASAAELMYQHPAYTFVKDVAGHAGTSNHTDRFMDSQEFAAYRGNNFRRTHFKFRHDYYSLGLLLLEIGLWQPLESVDPLESGPSSADVVEPEATFEPELGAFGISLLDQIRLRQSGANTATIRKPATLAARVSEIRNRTENLRKDLGSTRSSSTAAFPMLEDYMNTLRTVLDEEEIKGIELSISNAAAPYNMFWRTWASAYPFCVLRKEICAITDKRLGSVMGRRYRNVALRCLRGDFSIPSSSPEPGWLQAFNWLVVNELEKCSV